MLTMNNLKNAAKTLSPEELLEELNSRLKASGPKENKGQYDAIKTLVSRNRNTVKQLLGYELDEYLQDKKAVWAIIDAYNESPDEDSDE